MKSDGDSGFIRISNFYKVVARQRVAPTTHNEIEQDAIIPQWAIAVIVIGAGSLLFVVIFGAAVVSINCFYGTFSIAKDFLKMFFSFFLLILLKSKNSY